MAVNLISKSKHCLAQVLARRLKKRIETFDRRYGPVDRTELLKIISNPDFSHLEERLEELAKYPLSHNARTVRIHCLRAAGQEQEARTLAAVGVALYPESIILVKAFLQTHSSDLTEEERGAILSRIKPLPGSEEHGL